MMLVFTIANIFTAFGGLVSKIDDSAVQDQ
jgi:hypothetical protein